MGRNWKKTLRDGSERLSGRVSHPLWEWFIPTASVLRVPPQKDSFVLSNPKGADGSPSIAGPLPFPLHAKDTAKATAIVFMLFILSQDCVVIYTVNNESTL